MKGGGYWGSPQSATDRLWEHAAAKREAEREADNHIYGFENGDPQFHYHTSDPDRLCHTHPGATEPHSHARCTQCGYLLDTTSGTATCPCSEPNEEAE